MYTYTILYYVYGSLMLIGTTQTSDVQLRILLLLLSANRLKLQTYVRSEPGLSPIGKSIRDIH